MNNANLTKQIINHIYLSFGIMNDNNIHFDKYKSIKSNEFLSEKKISFEDENKNILKNNMWAIKISFDDTFINFYLIDCSISNENKEYAMIIKSDNSIVYGMYLIYNNLSIKDPLFSLSVDDGENWSLATISVQSTLLSVFENLKTSPNVVDSLKISNQDFEIISNFINHYNDFYGYSYEG